MVLHYGSGMNCTRLDLYLGIQTNDPELIQSQYLALSRQIPLLYAILAVNTVVLAATHYSSAPTLLVLGAPGLLCLATAIRSVMWLIRPQTDVTLAYAVRCLRTTTILTPLMTVAFTAWSLALFPFGNAYAQCHVAFYMSVTVISIIFCLMHLRTAALTVTAVVGIPFAVFFISTGQPMFIALAINFTLVMAGLIWILLGNYKDFSNLIATQRELVARHTEAEGLANDNFRLANIDGLTGLPNRRHFLNELGVALARAQANGARFAVALLDLDGFKGVNDAYGHAGGDDLLVETARQLSIFVGPSAFLARLGGDEFGAILTGNPNDAEVWAFGQSLCAALHDIEVRPGLVAGVSASAGLVVYPTGSDTAGHLFECADYALYYAKEHSRGEAVMFTAEHETIIRNASRLEQALRNADLERELHLVFQPIVDVGRHRIVAFEALARWTSPVLGPVSPGDFIPMAERIGLISQITEVLFRKALPTAATWPDSIKLSFNLSARDLASSQTMASLGRIIQEAGIAPGRIQLEVTETAIMQDMDQALETLEPMRHLGVGIALDDFGTGYSSFSHVHHLQPDVIKVDRSFVAGLHDSKLSRDILRTILDLSRNIGARCIVEGIETVEQRQHLTALGCQLMQGFLLGRPTTDVVDMLRLYDQALPIAHSPASSTGGAEVQQF